MTNKCHLKYEAMCKQEKQLNVYMRCVKNTAVLMYKIRKGLAPRYLNDLFVVQESQYKMCDSDGYRSLSLSSQFNLLCQDSGTLHSL